MHRICSENSMLDDYHFFLKCPFLIGHASILTLYGKFNFQFRKRPLSSYKWRRNVVKTICYLPEKFLI